MTDDLSTPDLSTAAERQLEIWAFGRQGAVSDRELAEAALLELARRAEVARAERARADERRAAAERAERDRAAARDDSTSGGAAGVDDEAASEHPESAAAIAAEWHRRRMRATGLAGVIAAVLGLGVVSTSLAAPDPDPLAVFDRAPSEADAEWELRLTQDFFVALTAGPRVIDVGDGLVGVAFRSAAVADGRSTAFDPYCLFTSEVTETGAPLSLSGSCLTPDRFATEGIVLPVRPSAEGTGFDTVVWGPTGAPVLERERELDAIGGITSVLDWMVYPSFAEGEDALAGVGEPDRLLMGPARVPFAVDDAIELGIAATVYVLEGETEAAGPVLCAAAATPSERATTACAPLEAVRRDGLAFTIIADDRDWVVTIGADGPDRADTLRRAD